MRVSTEARAERNTSDRCFRRVLSLKGDSVYTTDAKVFTSVIAKVPKCGAQKATGPSGRIIYAIIDVIAFEYSQLCASPELVTL